MKLYILAFATFVAAAGSASASSNIDYIDCDFRKQKTYSETDFRNYCGNQNREEQRFDDRDANSGAAPYGGSYSGNNY